MYKELEKIFGYKIPIKSIKEYAEYYLELQSRDINDQFNVKNFKTALKTEHDGDIHSFIKYKLSIIDEVINFIKDSVLYSEYFNKKKIEGSSIKGRNNVINFLTNNRNEYKIEDYSFIGVDVIAGNYNSFKIFYRNYLTEQEQKVVNKCENSKLVLNSKDMEELIRNIFKQSNIEENTKSIDTIVSSKAIRQVIFGNLNPKRNTLILSNYINKIRNNVDKNFNDDSVIELVTSQDEVIYAVKKEIKSNLKSLLKELKNSYLEKDIEAPIRIEEPDYTLIEGFTSNPKNTAKKFFLETTKGKRKLKTVPKNIYIPLYKKYILNEDTISKDFYHEDDGNIFEMKFVDIKMKTKINLNNESYNHLDI